MKNSFSRNGKDYDCGSDSCDIMHMENAQGRPLPARVLCSDKGRTSGEEETKVLSKNELAKRPCLLCGKLRAVTDRISFYADFSKRYWKS